MIKVKFGTSNAIPAGPFDCITINSIRTMDEYRNKLTESSEVWIKNSLIPEVDKLEDKVYAEELRCNGDYIIYLTLDIVPFMYSNKILESTVDIRVIITHSIMKKVFISRTTINELLNGNKILFTGTC